MRSSVRIVAAACALLMIALAFQAVGARANPPTSANEFNHALSSKGGVASASGSAGTNAPALAIDAGTSSYWESSSTTGWLAVAFSPRAYINEVHIHFLSGSTIYSALSLYLDSNANGVYDTTEKVWSVTKNAVRDVVVSVNTAFALGMKVTIDAKSGSNHPKIAEFEAYLRNDSDGDGLTNSQETGTIYYQDMGAGGLPTTVPDDGVNSAPSTVSLAQFYGLGVGALANFTVNHARKTDLTAQIGYWDGSTWVDRYVWDPGRRLDRVTITQPAANSFVDGTVSVVAIVDHPEITTKVEFRVRGGLQATVTTPVGNEYRWTWNAAAFSEGSATLNATQYDFAGAKAWHQITVNINKPPQMTWVSPANDATVSDTVTVQVTAVDAYGIQSVAFYVDGIYKSQVLYPNAGGNGYAWSWVTSAYCSNTQHTLKAVAAEGAPQYLTSSASVTVTASTYPLVCITAPAGGASLSGVVNVMATATAASGKSISKVAFYLSGSLQYTDTAAPWIWTWDTTYTGNGQYTVMATATDSASKTASSTITINVLNIGGGCTRPPCPISVTPVIKSAPSTDGALPADAVESAASSSAMPVSLSVGTLSSEWKRGEVDVSTQATVVVDLVKPQSQASSAENASRILRPGFPVSYFLTYLTWRLVIRDWNSAKVCLPAGDPACELWPAPGLILTFTIRVEVTSDPMKADTDGDGVSDYVEVATWGTLPVSRDSDADGLSDDYEIAPHPLTLTVNGVISTLPAFTTSPVKFDTDGDGLGDGEERSVGTDRVVTDPLKTDTDGDGLWDGLTVGTHLGELSYNANASKSDTDGDGFSDWVEVNPRNLALTINGAPATRSVTTLPYATDSDGDGLGDYQEWYGTTKYSVITDPSDPDTDRDGLFDGQERYQKDVAMPTRKSVGTYVSVSLPARISGPVEKVTVSYGLSGIDVSNFYVTLTQNSNTVYLRTYQGSGLYVVASADLPSSMWGGGTYTLYVWSMNTGGILEKYSILFTIRTSPVRADSDGDGLNDSEETSFGQDGWITDPNFADTDGDSWGDAYEISRGTNPTSVDTDGDGVWDASDLDPLRNLVVRVTVNKIHHGASPWCTPELVGVVRVNDAYTWVTQHLQATEDAFTSLLCPPPIPTTQRSTASFYMSYYADVPDDVSTFSLRMTAWAINPGRGDDILVDQIQYYALNSWYPTQTLWNANSWYSYDIATVGLQKSKTLLITDGQVTVQSAAGITRMAAPDRFVILDLSLSSAYYPLTPGINTILIPRSIFLDTRLKADLSAGYYAPLTNADTYSDDLSKTSISDGVAGVIAGTLTADQANDVLNRLLLNTSWGYSHSYVDITPQAGVANLPLDVVKILPWQSVTNGPIGGMPQDFWQKIGAVATLVVNSIVYVGQLIYKGLIALGTFLVDLAQAIVDWGMKALGAVANVIVSVAQKIADAAATLFNWVKDLAIAAFNLAVQGFTALINAVLGDVVNAIVNIARQKASIDNLMLGIPIVLGAVIKGKQLLERLFAAMEAVEASITVVLAIVSGGIAALIKGLIVAAAKDSVMDAIFGAVLGGIAATIAITAIESFDDDALNNIPGKAAKTFVGAVTALGAALDWLKARQEARGSGVSKWFSAAGWAMVGLLAELAGSPIVEELLAHFGLTDPLTRGIGQLGVDVAATVASSVGLWELFKKFPGEVFMEGTRKALLPITDKIENWVTYIGFFGSTSALGVHIGEGYYKGFT